MQMDYTELIGLLAGGCTTASFLPQVFHTWRTKSVEDISLRMYLLFTFGVAMWLTYGISIGSVAVTVANSITLVLATSILAMKIVYGRKPSAKNIDQRNK